MKSELTHSPTQEIPRPLCNPKVHSRIHNSPPLVLSLSEMNPVHTFPPISLRSVLILSYRLRLGLPSDLFP